MKLRASAILIFLMAATLCASATTVHPSATLNANVPGAKVFGLLGIPQVKLGEYIQVNVQITNTGKIPFRPVLKVVIKDPTGKVRFDKETKITTQIFPGETNTYRIKTNIKANRTGTWECFVTLYDQIGYKLDSKAQTFQVVESHASIDAINILGYVGATTAVLGSVLLIMRRRYFG